MTPEDHTTIHSKCGFEFSAPKSTIESPAQGDSCLNRYEASGCVYLGDYGANASALDQSDGQPNVRIDPKTIDGLLARVVSYGPTSSERPWFAGVHFRMTPKGPGQKFTFMAQCDDAEAQHTALELFDSLRFDR